MLNSQGSFGPISWVCHSWFMHILLPTLSVTLFLDLFFMLILFQGPHTLCTSVLLTTHQRPAIFSPWGWLSRILFSFDNSPFILLLSLERSIMPHCPCVSSKTLLITVVHDLPRKTELEWTFIKVTAEAMKLVRNLGFTCKYTWIV